MDELRKKNPTKKYRISTRSKFVLEQQRTGKWRQTCEHGKVPYSCKSCDGPGLCSHKRKRSQCIECGGSSTCEHKRLRSMCKECGGSGICEHNRIQSSCKECGGGTICEHNCVRSICKKCKGGSICEHDCVRSVCKKCKGGSICEHDKKRTVCRECGGGSFCDHGTKRSRCKECGGASICEHNRRKEYCIECEGSAMCQHKIRRSRCKECGGGEICEHDKQYSFCVECDGSSMCEHKKRRSRCKECGGKYVCGCGERLKQKDGFCIRCHPDFIETKVGSSKVACSFLDCLEKELKVSIQHIHYDFTGKTIMGNEHHPVKWPKKGVDGFYTDTNGQMIAIEFLGDYFHGHPRLWKVDPETKNHYGIPLKLLFEKTEEKLGKLGALGYTVIYIWECTFLKKPALTSVHSVCKIFNGKLEFQ